jgi:hypothetical protein
LSSALSKTDVLIATFDDEGENEPTFGEGEDDASLGIGGRSLSGVKSRTTSSALSSYMTDLKKMKRKNK